MSAIVDEVPATPYTFTNHDQSGKGEMDFLLPTGLMVPLTIDFFSSLDLIKKVRPSFN